jgi:hypothetical protein
LAFDPVGFRWDLLSTIEPEFRLEDDAAGAEAVGVAATVREIYFGHFRNGSVFVSSPEVNHIAANVSVDARGLVSKIAPRGNFRLPISRLFRSTPPRSAERYFSSRRKTRRDQDKKRPQRPVTEPNDRPSRPTQTKIFSRHNKDTSLGGLVRREMEVVGSRSALSDRTWTLLRNYYR